MTCGNGCDTRRGPLSLLSLDITAVTAVTAIGGGLLWERHVSD